MQLKWIGALLVIAGCGSFGFKMAHEYIGELNTLRQLNGLIEYMQNELRFHLTPLPELVRLTAQRSKGKLTALLNELAALLECNSSVDAAGCMTTALNNHPSVSESAVPVLKELGASLGSFDLDGQINGLEAARISCITAISSLEQEKTQRVRNYQILGLCAGAALAILFL